MKITRRNLLAGCLSSPLLCIPSAKVDDAPYTKKLVKLMKEVIHRETIEERWINILIANIKEHIDNIDIKNIYLLSFGCEPPKDGAICWFINIGINNLEHKTFKLYTPIIDKMNLSYILSRVANEIIPYCENKR
jgi:hypothetical protein